jgi:hypothetical protein
MIPPLVMIGHLHHSPHRGRGLPRTHPSAQLVLDLDIDCFSFFSYQEGTEACAVAYSAQARPRVRIVLLFVKPHDSLLSKRKGWGPYEGKQVNELRRGKK